MKTQLQNITVISHQSKEMNALQKIGSALAILGLFVLTLAFFKIDFNQRALWLYGSLIAILSGIVIYAQATYSHTTAGIKNDGVFFKSISNRGLWAWMIGILLTSFYVVLYWYPTYLGLGQDGKNSGLVAFFDPLSSALNGKPASQWFVYGTLYTVAILGLGYQFIWLWSK
jgi:hypothetical protein